MSTSIPKPLLKSAEFRPLGELARIVVRGLWKRGTEQAWDGRDELLTDLQSGGMFLGARGGAEFDAFLADCFGTGALVEEGGALTMPIFSADRPKGERTAVATRKDRQRELDELYPERVEERAARKAGRGGEAPGAPDAPPAGVTTGVTEPVVTRDGHVPGDVTEDARAVGGVGEEEDSISSSSSGDSGRGGARDAARPEAAPVTPAVTPGGTAPVTPAGPAVTPARGAARALLEDSRGAIFCGMPRSWCDSFDAELAEQLPDLTPERLAAAARFASDKKRLVAAFANYNASVSAEVTLSGRVSLQLLRGKKDDSGRHSYAPLVDLVRRGEDWAAAEAAKASKAPAGARASPGARSPPGAPAPERFQGSALGGLTFGPKRATPAGSAAAASGEKPK